jgi:hypothetical protein
MNIISFSLVLVVLIAVLILKDLNVVGMAKVKID